MTINKEDLKAIQMDITKIECSQQFGYQNIYYKKDFIKHRKKKINGIWYNTKQSKLIAYYNEYKSDSNFAIVFIYETLSGQYFKRSFDPMCECFELIKKDIAVYYLNKTKSIF